MKKKEGKQIIAIVLTICFSVCFVPTKAFAFPSLPNFTLPEQKPLETPSLSKDYTEMIEKLEEQDLGKYKHDPEESIPVPKVENPVLDRDAYDVFIEKYGDIWNEKELDKTSIIPDKEFFKNYIGLFASSSTDSFNEKSDKSMKDFSENSGKSKEYLEKKRDEGQKDLEQKKSEHESEFEKIKAEDKEMMAGLLKKELDLSGLWDMDAIKDKVKFQDANALLANVPKPAGWNSTKAKSNQVPDKSSWLEKGNKELAPILPFMTDRVKPTGGNGGNTGGTAPATVPTITPANSTVPSANKATSSSKPSFGETLRNQLSKPSSYIPLAVTGATIVAGGLATVAGAPVVAGAAAVAGITYLGSKAINGIKGIT